MMESALLYRPSVDAEWSRWEREFPERAALLDADAMAGRWPEARVLAEPVKTDKLTEPRVLVERTDTDLVTHDGRTIVCLPGEPVISLFTGAGGFDVGLENAGYTTVLQHEWNKEACDTLLANRPRYFRHAALIQGDLRATPTEMILEQAGMEVGETTILCGGPPCQGFSSANKHAIKGRDDTRSDLVFEYLRVVDESKPRFFIMENVPGFVRFKAGAYMRAFLERAYGCFYELVYGIVDCVRYGVPQYRQRFICMGTRRDLAAKGMLAALPKPQCFAEADLAKIRAINEQGLLVPLQSEDLECLMHPPGIRYFPDREVLIPPEPTHGGLVPKKYQEFYRNLRRNEPDRIVTYPEGGE